MEKQDIKTSKASICKSTSFKMNSVYVCVRPHPVHGWMYGLKDDVAVDGSVCRQMDGWMDPARNLLIKSMLHFVTKAGN